MAQRVLLALAAQAHHEGGSKARCLAASRDWWPWQGLGCRPHPRSATRGLRVCWSPAVSPRPCTHPQVRHTRPLKLVQLTEVEISSLCCLDAKRLPPCHALLAISHNCQPRLPRPRGLHGSVATLFYRLPVANSLLLHGAPVAHYCRPILLELGCPLKICGDVHGQSCWHVFKLTRLVLKIINAVLLTFIDNERRLRLSVVHHAETQLWVAVAQKLCLYEV